MKQWAKKFYHSAKWQKVRKLAILRAFGLCERCGQPGYIVHHIIALTPQNITDPNVTLNLELLIYLCKPCHDKEHLHSDGCAEGLQFDADGNIIKKRKGREDIE